jgi:hypothetical protein
VNSMLLINHDYNPRWDISRLVKLFLSREIVLLCTPLSIYQASRTRV